VIPGPLLAWLQASRIAATVGGSTQLTGFLSAIHLLGLTLVVGGALVSSLRLLGALLPERPVRDVTAAAGQGMLLGLTISVTSGLLLFAPRASAAAENTFFQVKMLLLVAASVFHFAVYRRVSRRRDASAGVLRLTGALGLALWFGVALAGCAFILLE
jgi:hypothetical protein